MSNENKHSGNDMLNRFNIRNLCVFPILYICVSCTNLKIDNDNLPNSINQAVFAVEMQYDFCDRNGSSTSTSPPPPPSSSSSKVEHVSQLHSQP
jgi:hypothetical protein